MAANKNSMTKQLYAKIKPQLKTPKDDKKVMKKYNYSKTTVQKIRNTRNWHDYEARTHRFDGYPRKNQPAISYRYMQDSYDDLKEGYKMKLLTASAVWFGLGVILGACAGIILTLFIGGKYE